MKANVLKIQLYIVNLDGNTKPDKDEWQAIFDNKLNSIALNNIARVGEFEAVEVEWHDDIDINKTAATIDEFDKYFPDKKAK